MMAVSRGTAVQAGGCSVRAASTALLTVLVLSGCGAMPEKPKTVTIGTDIEVSAELNPDARGRPSPMMLAIYQLKSADGFLSKDFFSVFDPEGAALGEDLIQRNQLMLQPGASQSIDAEIVREAAFIGVVGAFSDLDQARWRAVVKVPEKSLLGRINPFGGERLRIAVDARAVTVSIGEG